MKKIAVFVLLFTTVFSVVSCSHNDEQREKGGVKAGTSQELQQIEYWTCSMHPSVHQDGPGKCPICGMDLVPVYKQDENRISLDSGTAARLGISGTPAGKIRFVKELRFPARVSHDYELYMLEQKHLSALATESGSIPGVTQRGRSILESTRLRLKLLGFGDEQIAGLEKRGEPDESLIYPSKGRAWIGADIYEQDLGYVKKGMPVKVMIREAERQDYSGTIVAIETVLNEKTRSAKARIEVPDPSNLLRHEMYADVVLSADLGERLGIPRKSLIDTGTRKIVYVDMGDNKFETRQVEIGVVTNDMAEVVGGLKEGEIVVSDGNFLLDSQASLKGGESLMYDAGKEIKEDAGETHRH